MFTWTTIKNCPHKWVQTIDAGWINLDHAHMIQVVRDAEAVYCVKIFMYLNGAHSCAVWENSFETESLAMEWVNQKLYGDSKDG